MSRTLPLSLGVNDWQWRVEALNNLARRAGSSGQRGASYTSLNIDVSHAFKNEPDLCATLMSIVLLLKDVDLEDDARQHLLSQANDLKAQAVALGVIGE